MAWNLATLEAEGPESQSDTLGEGFKPSSPVLSGHWAPHTQLAVRVQRQACGCWGLRATCWFVASSVDRPWLDCRAVIDTYRTSLCLTQLGHTGTSWGRQAHPNTEVHTTQLLETCVSAGAFGAIRCMCLRWMPCPPLTWWMLCLCLSSRCVRLPLLWCLHAPLSEGGSHL